MRILKTMARLYVSDLDATLKALERLLGSPTGLRFHHGRLELASIGDLLVIAGTEADLAPFRATQATALVDDLDAVRRACEQDGDTILAAPRDVPTGRNMTARHPGGAIIEYVQFDAAKLRALGVAAEP